MDTLATQPRPSSWTDALLSPASSPAWRAAAKRLLVSAAFASLFGAALGARFGPVSMAVHALGVPAGLLALGALALPAFAIVLSLADAPVDGLTLAHASARAAAHGGLVLGGFAPAVALFAVTAEEPTTVALAGAAWLLLASLVAARSFASELSSRVQLSPPGTRRKVRAALIAFLVFAAVLLLRVWTLTLPIFGGSR